MIDKQRVLTSYHSGVRAVVHWSARVDQDHPDVCGQWTARDTVRHVIAVAGWYHDWLDRAEAGSSAPPFGAGELAERNAAALAATPDDVEYPALIERFRKPPTATRTGWSTGGILRTDFPAAPCRFARWRRGRGVASSCMGPGEGCRRASHAERPRRPVPCRRHVHGRGARRCVWGGAPAFGAVGCETQAVGATPMSKWTLGLTVLVAPHPPEPCGMPAGGRRLTRTWNSLTPSNSPAAAITVCW